jgi:hypothetical protein
MINPLLPAAKPRGMGPFRSAAQKTILTRLFLKMRITIMT